MKFSIVAEFGFIEETIKRLTATLLASTWLKFLSTSSSLLCFSKFLTVYENQPFVTASDLTHGLVRFELVF